VEAEVNPVYLFDLASRSNHWLSVRQSVVGQNVANASTPGFKSMDVKPFVEELSMAQLDMARTNRAHLPLESEAIAEPEVDAAASDQTNYSGNNVSLEREFQKSGEINRAYALNTGLLKTFNRMLLLSSKG
jgi:flagellar basal-body rod protein FlgB